jgi:DNA-binding beta-propeller fold protein YncE
MGRLTWAAVATAVLVAPVTGTSYAGTSGGGTTRWNADYRAGTDAYASAVALTPDGTTAVVTGATSFGSDSRFATLAYDTRTGEVLWESLSPGGGDGWGVGSDVVVSPDGRSAYVTGSQRCEGCPVPDGDAYLTIAYDTASGARKWLEWHPAGGGGPGGVTVSPDGDRVYVAGNRAGGERRTLISYDARSGERRWVVHRDGALAPGDSMAVSPDGRSIYWAGSDLPPEGPTACSFVASGMRVTAVAAGDGSERWTAMSRVADGYLCGRATSLALSADGSHLVVAGYGGERSRFSGGLASLDPADGTVLWETREDDVQVLDGDTVVDVVLDPGGSRAYLLGGGCLDDRCARAPFVAAAYDTANGQRDWLSTYDGGGTGYPADLEVSPDGGSLFATGQMSLPCYSGCIFSQVIAPLVSWDAATGDARWATVYEDEVAFGVTVSADGSATYLAGTFTEPPRHTGRSSRGTACDGGACGYSTVRVNTGPGPGRLDDTDAAPDLGGWRTTFDATAVGASYRSSGRAGDVASFSSGRSAFVELLTRQGPDQGVAEVFLDGQSQGPVDLYAPEAGPRVIRFDGLEKQRHTLTVRVQGTGSPSSTGTAVAIDGFRVRAGYGIHQESHPSIRYDGWRGVTSDRALGGSLRRSSSPEDSMSLTFRGRSLKLVTARGPAYGRMAVVVDGERRRVDLYAPRRDWRVPVRFGGLGSGRHELVLRPLGTRRPASRGSAVVVDGFVVG